jgi:hypothetical protein
MAHDHARIRLAIWNDDDFRALSCAAQHLYFMLLTHSELSYCGVADWRPARLAGKVGDWTADVVNAAASELIDRLYILVDERTEEVLVRSFVRHDGLMAMPKMAIAMTTAHTAVGSVPLRQVIVWELQRLHREDPKLKGWAPDRVAALLKNPSLDPSTYPCGNPRSEGSPNPSGNPSPNPSGNPSGKGSGYPSASPSSLLLTPNSETSSLSVPADADTAERPTLTVVAGVEEKPSRRKPQRPLPDNFALDDDMRAWVSSRGYVAADVKRQTERFKAYALSKDQRYADWVQAWRNWMDRAAEQGDIRRGGSGGTARAAKPPWEL